ncbi:hypothetical protein AB0D27_01745 [Streptomyces sp. NPDC048415]|uniref:hypothetical protein n=1 Tax=Streptomyces sp. NPDC048415 TaxID=3154822 RepID=UPI003427BE0F
MTVPDIHLEFAGRYLGDDEDGPTNWSELEDYFKPQCGGTLCVTLVRRPVSYDFGQDCGYIEAVASRNPYYRHDTIYINVKAPCPAPTDDSGGATTQGGVDAGQDAGQDAGGQDAGQDAGSGSGGGTDQGVSSPATPS